jgi:hypothetical protein
MRSLRNLVAVSCLAALFGCGNLGHKSDSVVGDLEIVNADAKTGIEASYTEGGHTLLLRSRSVGNALQSGLFDGDLSIGARARYVIERATAFRTPGGQPAVTVRQRFADALRFSWALKLARHAIRQLHEVLPTEIAEGPPLAALEKEMASIREALAKTNLLLLEEWGSESRRQLELTPEEHARFFAIFNQQARQVAARARAALSTKQVNAPSVGVSAGATATARRPSDELAALLGPERYQKYQALQRSWIAANGGEGTQVLP